MAKRYIVRHGALRQLGEYEAPADDELERGVQVVIRSPRGLETGVVLCEATERVCALLVEPTQGQIVRRLSDQDRAEVRRLKDVEQHEFDVGLRLIDQRRLQMELINVEHLLGGDRAVFYFLSKPPDRRIDFRELVRDLARELQVRIEMRQIGLRDEAKLLADYGDCGKPVCCNTHMPVLPPVSMRMAKIQKSTLDPNKISGRCGRLKCCLRFENHVYEEIVQELPAVGSRIATKKGQGRVLAQEVLARRLLVQFDDGRRIIVEAAEIAD